MRYTSLAEPDISGKLSWLITTPPPNSAFRLETRAPQRSIMPKRFTLALLTILPLAITACGESPLPIPQLKNVQAISAGGSFGLALKQDGTVIAWGENRYG